MKIVTYPSLFSFRMRVKQDLTVQTLKHAITVTHNNSTKFSTITAVYLLNHTAPYPTIMDHCTSCFHNHNDKVSELHWKKLLVL